MSLTWSLPSRSQKNNRCGRGCERADSLNRQRPLRPSRAIRAGVQRRKQSTCTFLGKGGEGLKVEQQPVPRQGAGRSNKWAPATEARWVGSREAGMGCSETPRAPRPAGAQELSPGGFQEGRDPIGHEVREAQGHSVWLATQRLLWEPMARKAATQGLARGWESMFAVGLAGRWMDCCWAWVWPGLRQGANEMLGRADGLNTAGAWITSLVQCRQVIILRRCHGNFTLVDIY